MKLGIKNIDKKFSAAICTLNLFLDYISTSVARIKVTFTQDYL